jgi:hypothetical protein
VKKIRRKSQSPPLLKILTEQAQRIQQLLIKRARLSEEYEVDEGGASGHDKIAADQSLSGTSRQAANT